MKQPQLLTGPLSISPAEARKHLATHQKIIGLSIRGMRKGAAEMYGYAYIAGKEMGAAKLTLAHGNTDEPEAGLMNWLAKHFPEITDRTARNWISFARDIDARAPELEAYKKTPLQLGQGKLTKKGREAILEIVPSLMDGKTMTQFMRDSRLAKDPEPQKHTPAKEPTAEELLTAQQQHVQTLVANFTAAAQAILDLNDVDRTHITAKSAEVMAAAAQRISSFLKS